MSNSVPAPIGDHIIAVRPAPKTQTASGILLPESRHEKSVYVEVVAVSEDAPVLVGDRVIFKEYSSTEIVVNGVTYLILKYEDLLATV